ncbi:type II toxin-antitoxin system Phd/YefM family antitoxin [Lapillicoccus jejuensis]
MTRATSRELRKDTEGVLRRAAAGELIEITVNGEAVAALSPLTASRPR